jgi:hypothetical protein
MTIKVQTLDNIFNLKTKKNSSIQDIKEKITEVKNNKINKNKTIYNKYI